VKLFHWGLLLRYMVYGVLPLIVLFIVLENLVGASSVGEYFVVLALLLPFIAIGWLAWQHFRHRRARPLTATTGSPPRHKGHQELP